MADEPRTTRTLDACARPECLDRVHALLGELWEDAPDIDFSARMRFEIAVAEVAANIVEHAGSPEQGVVDLNLRLMSFDDRVEARFRDTGRAADVDLATARLPEDAAEDGRGLAIALAAVDEVSYERDGDVNCWLVVQRHA